MSSQTSFQQYLQSAFTSGPWSTDEVIEFVLPLFEEVLDFHENNQVGSFERTDSIIVSNGRLDIDELHTHDAIHNLKALRPILEYQVIGGYQVTDRLIVDEDLTSSTREILSQQVQADRTAALTQPVFLPGYQCWEMLCGHHDAQTDIFNLGLILGSVVMGLDLYDLADLQEFAAYREQPAGVNSRVHPTVSALVTEMTELDRAKRSPDLHEIIQRLKHYRDYDPQKQIDLARLAAFEIKKPSDRRGFILSKLRNRLFDTSRRNRLLYYKPNARFVNLTVSSVPMVLHFQSINPALLFTWNSEISGMVTRQNDIPLNKYLRFEDHPYLNSQLNGIRQASENDKKEYGFSQLKLVVAFLHWHNLKESVDERIQSPLLLLPVELERKKSLKEEKFTVKLIDNAALVNPILANHLKDLYGIELPESIDFDDHSMEDFFQMLRSKINDARQGVKLNYIDKPRIRIIHNIARQTINNYRKKLKLKGQPSFHQVDYSYGEDDYKPLGLELFRQKVEPKQSHLEFLIRDQKPAGPSVGNFSDAAAPVTRTTYEMAEGQRNAYSWDFDVCNIVLGNFNYKKMSLVSDYNKVADGHIEHPVFDELFSNAPRKAPESIPGNDPGEWYHVITADPTQSRSILYSRKGESYIIQGPPGTGKSQTITNLIADFLARGKTVLFVCEKRAALDVVYHRLQQNQLSELCCYIHDSQGDKKEFFRDLRLIYDDFLKNKMDIGTISLQRKNLLSRLLEHIDILSQYHRQQRLVTDEAGISTRKLMETLVELKGFVPKLDVAQGETVPVYSEWLRFGQVIRQLSKALENTGAEPKLAAHPFSNLGLALIRSDNPFNLLQSLTGPALKALNQLGELLRNWEIPPQHSGTFGNIKNLVQDSVLMESLAATGNLALVRQSSKEASAFERAYGRYKKAKQVHLEASAVNSPWKRKFTRPELQVAMEIAAKQETSFFKFLSGSWKRLKKDMADAFDINASKTGQSVSIILKFLQDEYTAEEQVRALADELQDKYQLDNIETVVVGIDVLRRKEGDEEIDFLLAHPRPNQLVLDLARSNYTLQQLESQLGQLLFSYDKKSLSVIRDEIATISGNSEVLRDLLPGLRKFAEIPSGTQSFVRTLPLTPLEAEAAMASKTLDNYLRGNQVFSGTTQQILQDAVSGIEGLYKDLLKVNSDYIRAVRRQNFLQHYEITQTAAAQLTPEQKLFKPLYQKGRQILEHEMGKTMRYKSIREMASNESGRVLKDLKPVWLMSPLSVSDSLPLDVGFFDVVIFDEASQITLEEGIPALFRGPQAIIVGDDKQMPPSNFFNAKAEDPEDLEMIEGETEDEILSADADSLLVQGSRKLNSTMLSWHYRSRYETLISYSNHAFYEAGLLTIPDRTTFHQERPLLQVGSPEEGARNTDLLLQESMSYHYMPGNVYQARGNMGEAKYIAVMVRELLLRDAKETIGIVAFSQEQQGVIEEAIDSLAANDKLFDEALEKAYSRKDEGQFTGLFIKNLENVQGDERDIIIMSVCYGYDANKKMLMNFGPINRKGGEKRLNVIFSRAKKHMAVVSSIRHNDITNDHNEGANYFKRFLHYSEMIATGNYSTARTILDGLVRTDQQKKEQEDELAVTTTSIRKALEAKGYVVDERVGQSNFKCSLAVKRKAGDDQYLLGILVDDSFHYQNDDLVEQYYQRPAILEAFGWRVMNVFAKDWLENSEVMLGSIIRRIENQDTVALPVKPAPGVIVQPVIKENPFMELRSPDGSSFWKIRQDGLRLEIQSGKLGHKGMVQVRTFDSPEDVLAEKEMLLGKKETEGFTDAGSGGL
ncbi:MAG: DUF4011 domain-containing protein [Chitinophagaceae bacterium]|nr:MAG: DUF4011 domain-containing protein [Chitinophagaceae bacterium]